MHILNVSEERAKDIEKLTRGQADNKVSGAAVEDHSFEIWGDI